MRDLDQDPGAVARVIFAAAGPAVAQVVEGLQSLLDDFKRLAALNIHDKTRPAGVFFKRRVIEALFGR